MSLWPRLGVGGVVIHQNRVLLVQRRRPPAAGTWAIPGGKVEAGETLHQAVVRELREECGIEVKVGALVSQFEFIDQGEAGLNYHYVVLDFMADYVAGEARAGDDAAAVAWFTPGQLQGVAVERNTRQLLQQINFSDG